jgi:hypothetical protein
MGVPDGSRYTPEKVTSEGSAVAKPLGTVTSAITKATKTPAIVRRLGVAKPNLSFLRMRILSMK